MAESQRPASPNTEKRPEGKGKGRQIRRFKHENDIKKKDPDAVLIHNFMWFKEALSTKALQEYDMLASSSRKGPLMNPQRQTEVMLTWQMNSKIRSTSMTSSLTRK
jgi:hypothetical protein